jgi:hypothetical protein
MWDNDEMAASSSTSHSKQGGKSKKDDNASIHTRADDDSYDSKDYYRSNYSHWSEQKKSTKIQLIPTRILKLPTIEPLTVKPLLTRLKRFAKLYKICASGSTAP